MFLVGCTPTPLPPPQIALEPVEEVVARPKADPNAIEPITYEDLDLPMEPDTLFQEWMLTQRVRDLDGRKVRISGYMFGGSLFTTGNVKRFYMLREKECPFGPGGQAHHAVEVELEDQAIRFREGPVTIEGRLTLRPFTGENGKTWSLYHLAGRKVD